MGITGPTHNLLGLAFSKRDSQGVTMERLARERAPRACSLRDQDAPFDGLRSWLADPACKFRPPADGI